MKFLQKLRQARLEYALESVDNLLIELKWLTPNLVYKICRFTRKVLKVFKYIPVIWHDEDWDQEYMLDLLKFKLTYMRDYLANGVLAGQEKRDISIQINQALDHINNYINADEKFEEIYGSKVPVTWDIVPLDNEAGSKVEWINEETGKPLTEKESLLHTGDIQSRFAFEQREWDAIWDTIKKYGQGWWDQSVDTKTKDLIKDSTLCSNNLQVKFYLQELKKKLKKIGVTDEDVLNLISDSQEVLKVMKRQGQKIEDRARDYRRHIEALGFVRKSKQKDLIG